MSFEKLAVFAAGVLFGTAGVKLLSSKALRAKESVMKTYTTVKENAEDILADAKAINEDRAAAEEAQVIEDATAEAAAETAAE